MREDFLNILNDYKEAYKEEFTNHPLAVSIRKELPDLIKKTIIDSDRYLIKGSAGAGNWTAIPWLAIFDRLVTNTAQSGYYPVFLFRDDMSGFYLSLNQGVTEIKQKYKSEAKHVLKLKASDFRAQLGTLSKNFNTTEIRLKFLSSTKSPLSSLYEAGNILAKFYSIENIPSNEEFQNDILEILKIYESLSYNEGLPMSQAEKEEDEENFKGFEELKKFRFHKRIERNVQLSKKVKLVQGFTCKACNINLEDRYGEIGKNYIEAHHLTPISKLEGNKIKLDIRYDFVVLCPNCHSMIHKLSDPSDLELLKSLIR